jgi:hypothetical protein
MTTHDCWICLTPPAHLSRAFLQTRCVCGFELQFHNLGPPHAMASIGCQGFLAQVPLCTPQKDSWQTELFQDVTP